MNLYGKKISRVRVLNIMEESAEATEKMVNLAIREINEENIKILDIQTTGDNLIFILGEKETWSQKHKDFRKS